MGLCQGLVCFCSIWSNSTSWEGMLFTLLWTIQVFSVCGRLFQREGCSVFKMFSVLFSCWFYSHWQCLTGPLWHKTYERGIASVCGGWKTYKTKAFSPAHPSFLNFSENQKSNFLCLKISLLSYFLFVYTAIVPIAFNRNFTSKQTAEKGWL